MFQATRTVKAARRQTAILARSYHPGRPLCINGWVEVVEQRYDPKSKGWKHEDPDATVGRMQEEVNSKGETIRINRNERHTNPSTFKKELNNKRAYDRKKSQVMDLIKYIHFIKDHKHKDNW